MNGVKFSGSSCFIRSEAGWGVSYRILPLTATKERTLYGGCRFASPEKAGFFSVRLLQLFERLSTHGLPIVIVILNYINAPIQLHYLAQFLGSHSVARHKCDV